MPVRGFPRYRELRIKMCLYDSLKILIQPIIVLVSPDAPKTPFQTVRIRGQVHSMDGLDPFSASSFLMDRVYLHVLTTVLPHSLLGSDLLSS